MRTAPRYTMIHIIQMQSCRVTLDNENDGNGMGLEYVAPCIHSTHRFLFEYDWLKSCFNALKLYISQYNNVLTKSMAMLTLCFDLKHSELELKIDWRAAKWEWNNIEAFVRISWSQPQDHNKQSQSNNIIDILWQILFILSATQPPSQGLRSIMEILRICQKSVKTKIDSQFSSTKQNIVLETF